MDELQMHRSAFRKNGLPAYLPVMVLSRNLFKILIHIQGWASIELFSKEKDLQVYLPTNIQS